MINTQQNRKKVTSLMILMRPTQWTKNLFVFAAAIFANQFFREDICIRILLTFVAFCLTSSIVYILNDWKDREEDKIHPVKCKRPIASGSVSSTEAFLFAVILVVIVIGINLIIKDHLWLIFCVYVLMNVAYSFWLKHVVILDILVVSMGFILRAIAGGVVIEVEISKWLLLCTFFLALFLILNKRRSEFVSLGDDAQAHRQILADYTLSMLDQITAVVAGLTIIAYSLYTLSPTTIDKFGTDNLVYTVPFVVFGLFKYLHLVNKKQMGDRPESILLKDRSIQLSVVLWIVTVVIIIY